MSTTQMRRIYTHEELPQGSQEWKDFRRGKISGTKSKVIGGARNKEGIVNMIKKLEDEISPDYKHPNFSNAAMDHGNRYEPDAREHYKLFRENTTEGAVVEVGAVQTIPWEGLVILSPDFLVANPTKTVFNEDKTVDVKNTTYIGAGEIKCRSVKEWEKFKEKGVIPKDAMHQIRHYFVTLPELEWVDYIEYNPFEITENQRLTKRVYRTDELKVISAVETRITAVYNHMYSNLNKVDEVEEPVTTETTTEEIVEAEIVEDIIPTEETTPTIQPTMSIDMSPMVGFDFNKLQQTFSSLEVEVLTTLGVSNNVPEITAKNLVAWSDKLKVLKKIKSKVNKTRLAEDKPLREFTKLIKNAYDELGEKLTEPISSIEFKVEEYNRILLEEQEKAAEKLREENAKLYEKRVEELTAVNVLPIEIEALVLDGMDEETYQKFLTMYTKRNKMIVMSTPPPVADNVQSTFNEADAEIIEEVVEVKAEEPVSVAGYLKPNDYIMFNNIYNFLVTTQTPIPENEQCMTLVKKKEEFQMFLKVSLGIK